MGSARVNTANRVSMAKPMSPRIGRFASRVVDAAPGHVGWLKQRGSTQSSASGGGEAQTRWIPCVSTVSMKSLAQCTGTSSRIRVSTEVTDAYEHGTRDTEEHLLLMALYTL